MTSAFGAFLSKRAATMLDVAPVVATPRVFSDVTREHLATRRAAGLFDFSFMGCVEAAGRDAVAFLHALQTRDLTRLAAGRIAYTLMLRDDGTVLNDATVWRLDEDRYRIFTGRRADLDHVRAIGNRFALTLTDVSARHAVIALQGPLSARILARCFDNRAVQIPYFGFRNAPFGNETCAIARIGYSGETGYEIVIAEDVAAQLWRALLDAGETDGLLECGFEATDALRIEAGHILFMRELASPVTPAEIGFMRLVDVYAHDFCGARALRGGRNAARCLTGMLPAALRAGSLRLPPQIAEGHGFMTSAAYSPVFGRALGIGFVNPADAYPGARVRLEDGTRAAVTRLPFYDPGKVLPRRG